MSPPCSCGAIQPLALMLSACADPYHVDALLMRKTSPRVLRFVRSNPLSLSHHTIVTPPTILPIGAVVIRPTMRP